eukprot:GFUD01086397.1.p1 GENE.GFUD01086397.1~~GFUD01086397.1.p1  ORF type:complete len:350 (-),score=88.61 GFUD01086397.1:50-1027(-)
MTKETEDSIHETNDHYEVYDDLEDSKIDKEKAMKYDRNIKAKEDHVYETAIQSKPQPEETAFIKCTKKQFLVLIISILITLIVGLVVLALALGRGTNSIDLSKKGNSSETLNSKWLNIASDCFKFDVDACEESCSWEHSNDVCNQLGGQLAEPKTNLTINNRLSVMETRMEHLQPQMSTLDTRIEHLEPQMSTLETRMEHLEPQMKTLETRLEQVEHQMSTMALVLGKDKDNLDDLATSACVGFSPSSKTVVAVRRECSSEAADCNTVCQNAEVFANGSANKWSCIDALHVYTRSNLGNEPKVGKYGPVIYHYGGCSGSFCGPNY